MRAGIDAVRHSSTPGTFQRVSPTPLPAMRCTAEQLMVVDAAIVRAGDGAQLGPAVRHLQGLDLLGAMGREPILQVDAGERGRKLAQIRGRRTDKAGELAEAPMGWQDGRIAAWQHQREDARDPPGSPRP